MKSDSPIEPSVTGLDRLASYGFELPRELIAQAPAVRRESSRLLGLDRATGLLSHGTFCDLARELGPTDLLVVNDSRVEPWRLFGRRVETGGRVEVLLVETRDDHRWRALVRAGGRLQPGEEVELESGALRFKLFERGVEGDWWGKLESTDGRQVTTTLREVGRPPLPPYIRRSPTDLKQLALDRERYQTVYARQPGSIAAPTAGLHFSRELMNELLERGVQQVSVTLHVGLGTFKPVTVSELDRHPMHSERFELTVEAAAALNRARSRGHRIIAVGTTSCRVLESVVNEAGHFVARSGETRLFIRPPYRFRAIDALITNFHLPGSTLLMLVSAFAGYQRVRAAYFEAIARRYRFFSYGDAMWIH